MAGAGGQSHSPTRTAATPQSSHRVGTEPCHPRGTEDTDTLGRDRATWGSRADGQSGEHRHAGDTRGTRAHAGRGERGGNRFPRGNGGHRDVRTQVTRGQSGQDGGTQEDPGTRGTGDTGEGPEAPRPRPGEVPAVATPPPSRTRPLLVTTPPAGQRPGRARAPPLPPAARPLPPRPFRGTNQRQRRAPWSLLRLHSIGRCRRWGGATARVGGSAAPTWFLQGAAAGSRTERGRAGPTGRVRAGSGPEGPRSGLNPNGAGAGRHGSAAGSAAGGRTRG